MIHNPMLAIADAINDRRRTTLALSMLADLIDHSGRTGGPELECDSRARAELLDMFVERMRANDDLIDGLIRDVGRRPQ